MPEVLRTTAMDEALEKKRSENQVCKSYRFGGMSRGTAICRNCGHYRKSHYNNPRGPQVSSRAVLSAEKLEEDRALPWGMFAETVGAVTYDLMTKVGYDHDIKISIKKLPGEHPEAPGYEVVAKMRLP